MDFLRFRRFILLPAALLVIWMPRFSLASQCISIWNEDVQISGGLVERLSAELKENRLVKKRDVQIDSLARQQKIIEALGPSIGDQSGHAAIVLRVFVHQQGLALKLYPKKLKVDLPEGVIREGVLAQQSSPFSIKCGELSSSSNPWVFAGVTASLLFQKKALCEPLILMKFISV